MSICERKREIRRRRHRREKYQVFKRKLATATASERTAIIEKIRKLAPDPDVVFRNLSLLEESQRV